MTLHKIVTFTLFNFGVQGTITLCGGERGGGGTENNRRGLLLEHTNDSISVHCYAKRRNPYLS